MQFAYKQTITTTWLQYRGYNCNRACWQINPTLIIPHLINAPTHRQGISSTHQSHKPPSFPPRSSYSSVEHDLAARQPTPRCNMPLCEPWLTGSQIVLNDFLGICRSHERLWEGRARLGWQMSCYMTWNDRKLTGFLLKEIQKERLSVYI